MKGTRRPRRVDSVLDAVLDSYGIREQVERMTAVELWPEVVGDRLAEVTRAKVVDGGALIVEVRNSAWLMELNMMRGEFLERMNDRLPEVSLDRIVFVQAETG